MKGGVGRQRGTKVREAGERVTRDSDPPSPPPPRHMQQKENPFSFRAAAIAPPVHSLSVSHRLRILKFGILWSFSA